MRKFIKAAGCAALFAAGTASGSTFAEAPAPSGWEARNKVAIAHPDWSRDAVLYQINTRQFTPEGTFRAAQAQLPLLGVVAFGPSSDIDKQRPLGKLLVLVKVLERIAGE